MFKYTIALLGLMLFYGCDSKKVELECPRCEATICPEVPSDVSVLEKYMKDWVCIEKHCFKVMKKNADGGAQ